MHYLVWTYCCKRPNYDFCISQGSVATVFKWGGQNRGHFRRFFVMFRAQNYLNRPKFHRVIQKITLAQFFETRCGLPVRRLLPVRVHTGRDVSA